MSALLAAFVAFAGAHGLSLQDEKLELRVRQTLRIGGPVAAWRARDLDGDGRVELLVVDRAGRVVVLRTGADARFPESVEGGVRLPRPERTLLGFLPAAARAAGAEGAAAVEPEPERERFDLLVADPDGVRVHRLRAHGGFEPAAEPLAPKAAFTLRTGEPTFCELAQDVNGDGKPELVLPAGRGVELWMERRGADGALGYELAASVPLSVRHSQSAGAALASDVLEETLSIPELSAEDVNGDGRADLGVPEDVRRAFHLQRADGSYPKAPDVVLDLTLFRDTTPQAPLAPGRTVVLGDDASVRSADLDNDGIPDYVIAHRRKVWVFHGGADGPQFTAPSSILKTAEDVTGLFLLNLDGDDYIDLVIFKAVAPSIGALIAGMLQSWEVEITVSGYRSEAGKKFATRPTDQGDVVLRLPPLLDILRRPEDLLGRFEEAERAFRPAASGDFDGDGTADLALVGDEGRRLELFRTPRGTALESEDAGEWLRKLVFDQEDPVFSIDRLLEVLSSFGQRRTARLTGGRASDARVDLAEGTGLPLVAAIPGDVDGDGREEILAAFESLDGRLVVQVIELAGKR